MPLYPYATHYIKAELFAPTIRILQGSAHLTPLERVQILELVGRQMPPPGSRRTLEVDVELLSREYPPHLEIKEFGTLEDGIICRDHFRYNWGASFQTRYGFASSEHENGNHYHERGANGRPIEDLGITDPESKCDLLTFFYSWIRGNGVEL